MSGQPNAIPPLHGPLGGMQNPLSINLGLWWNSRHRALKTPRLTAWGCDSLLADQFHSLVSQRTRRIYTPQCARLAPWLGAAPSGTTISQMPSARQRLS